MEFWHGAPGYFSALEMVDWLIWDQVNLGNQATGKSI
jgi:hypothetical protein